MKIVGEKTAKQYEILIYTCAKYVKCEWLLFVIVDISKIDEDLPQVLDTPNTTSKSSPIKSKPEEEDSSPPGSDGKSQPSEPNSDTQTDSSSAAAAGSTEQKSEETPAESKPEPNPEALTAET